MRTWPLPPGLCQVPFCKRMRAKLGEVKKPAQGHTAVSAGAEVEGAFPDSLPLTFEDVTAWLLTAQWWLARWRGLRCRRRLRCRRCLRVHPSSRCAFASGSRVRPDRRCAPRSPVGIPCPAPGSRSRLRRHVTACLTASSQTGSCRGRSAPGWRCRLSKASLPAVMVLGIRRVAHGPVETDSDPAFPAQT